MSVDEEEYWEQFETEEHLNRLRETLTGDPMRYPESVRGASK